MDVLFPINLDLTLTVVHRRRTLGPLGFTAMDRTNEALINKLELEAGKTNGNILTDNEWKAARELVLASATRPSLAALLKEMKTASNASFPHGSQAARRQRLRIALAPHKRLPSELIAQIFSHCSDVIQFPPNFSALPWVLIRVCVLWRTVAFGEHTLWNRVEIREGVSTADHITFINALFPSSGSLAISLHTTADANPLIKGLIRPHLERVDYLSLRLSVPNFTIWELPKESFRTLKSLSLHIPWDPYNNMPLYIDPHTFKSAHYLRRLKLASGRQEYSALLDLTFPWGQLTDLDICELSDLDLVQVFTVLKGCESVERLAIPVNGNYSEPHIYNSFTNGLQLTHLNSLKILGELSDEFLTIPIPWNQLTELTIIHTYSNFKEPISPLLQQCIVLTSLSLEYSWSYFSNPFSEGEVRITTLQTLTLTLGAIKSLQYLHVPALTSLHIRSGNYSIYAKPQPAWEIAAFLSYEDSCSLRTLKYSHPPVLPPASEGMPEDADGWIAVLESLHSIESFSAPRVMLSKVIMKRIARGELMPHVRHLVAQVEDPQIFAGMVQARLGGIETPGGILREAHGYFFPSPPPIGLGKARNRLAALNQLFGTWCSLRSISSL
ncbi:hypothetical protein DXG01_014699 [Tephrocybe rancida]|nr:hypothetical protein DXG01_014699 [Tephrocybe rancida]